MNPLLIKLNLPEYSTNVSPDKNVGRTAPDYLTIGREVDGAIEGKLPDGRYVGRAIGLDEHSGKSLDELVSIILEFGTDKYDSDRKEVCADEFAMYDHDIQAGSFEIKHHKIVVDESSDIPSMFGDYVKKFYENVLLDRGYRVRLDLLIIYDASKLERADLIDPTAKRIRPELEECLYKFKEPNRKQEALVGIVKILR